MARKSKPTRRKGQPVKHGNPRTPLTLKIPLSLPPAVSEPVTTSSAVEPVALVPPGPLAYPMYAEDGKMRATAVKIVTLRHAGMGEDEIAKALGLSRITLKGYVYKAAKNGWLSFDDPKDQMEYQVMHKVVRNLDEALDSGGVLMNGMPVRTQVALKVGEGTLFKAFSEQAPPTQQTVVAIKIEMPTGGDTARIREGTTGGAPAFVDAEPAS